MPYLENLIGEIMVTSILTVLFLCLLEGLLSLDNALVLAVMVKDLPPKEQKRALTYGIWGAFALRAIAMLFLTAIMHNHWIKIIGGAYLLFLALKYFISTKAELEEDTQQQKPIPKASSFWRVVVMVEMMDAVFSIDSILTAVSVSDVYWIVLTGGILGIIMMRFAATIFIKLLKWFPRLETVAYALIAFIGAKLLIEQLCRGVA